MSRRAIKREESAWGEQCRRIAEEEERHGEWDYKTECARSVEIYFQKQGELGPDLLPLKKGGLK